MVPQTPQAAQIQPEWRTDITLERDGRDHAVFPHDRTGYEMTSMREYVDAMRGEGEWDRMHGLIDGKEVVGWALVPVTVDGELVHIFPGTDPEATLEDVQNDVRKAIVELDTK